MHALSTEYHAQTNLADMAGDVAAHLQTHQLYGRAAIVTDNPAAMLALVKKAWRGLERELRQRREQTINPLKRIDLRNQLLYMRSCTFTIAPPIEQSYEQVQIATSQQFLAWPPQCAVMYITSTIDQADLHFITSWMPRYGKVVLYDRGPT